MQNIENHYNNNNQNNEIINENTSNSQNLEENLHNNILNYQMTRRTRYNISNLSNYFNIESHNLRRIQYLNNSNRNASMLSITNKIKSFKNNLKIIGKALFLPCILKVCILIIFLLIPILFLTSPFNILKSISNKENITFDIEINYMFLIPFYFIFCIIWWSILNIIDNFSIQLDFFKLNNKLSHNYNTTNNNRLNENLEETESNMFAFNPVIYLAVVSRLNNNFLNSQFDKIYWISIATVYDFIYLYSSRLLFYCYNNIYKLQNIDKINYYKKVVKLKLGILMIITVIYMLLLNEVNSYIFGKFYSDINLLSITFKFLIFFKGLFLLSNQIEIYFKIILIFNQNDLTYLINEYRFISDNRKKAIFVVINKFFLTIYMFILITSKKNKESKFYGLFYFFWSILIIKSICTIFKELFKYRALVIFYKEVNRLYVYYIFYIYYFKTSNL